MNQHVYLHIYIHGVETQTPRSRLNGIISEEMKKKTIEAYPV